MSRLIHLRSSLRIFVHVFSPRTYFLLPIGSVILNVLEIKSMSVKPIRSIKNRNAMRRQTLEQGNACFPSYAYAQDVLQR